MTQASPQLDTERQTLLARLRQSRETYLRSVANIAENAAAFRPAQDAWSILECAEHVAVAERQMLALWVKLAAPGGSDPAQDRVVPARAADRAQKQTAPERSRPTGRYPGLAEAVKDFENNRARTIAYVENNAGDLRGKIVNHPLMGSLDGYQLMLLMAGHAERHAAQIEDTRNQAGYAAAARA